MKAQSEDFLEIGGSPVPGFTLRHVLPGHTNIINRIAWSPNGNRIASASDDKTINLWDADKGTLLQTYDQHGLWVMSLAWSPNGDWLASGSADMTIRLWDMSRPDKHGSTHRVLIGNDHSVCALAWAIDGHKLVSGSTQGKLMLWDVENDIAPKILDQGEGGGISALAWSPDGLTLASSLYKGFPGAYSTQNSNINLHSIQTGDRYPLLGHKDQVSSVVWSPDGKFIASASHDKTIRIWSASARKELHILEGHADHVHFLSYSADGQLLASKSCDGTIRLWRCDTWETVAILKESKSGESSRFMGLAFHPKAPVLATLGKGGTVIRIWDLSPDVLLRSESVSATVRYTTAKLVLVGDSGVGKTGLGWRLAHGMFTEQASTHGQQFWVIDDLRTKRNDGTECEAVLWDLAGQHIYRLIHAIFLDNVDFALVLFDPTNRQEPLKGVQYWLEQLAGKHKAPPSVLVGARVDRGASVLSQHEMEQFCQQYGISCGYISTSAMTGDGLNQLLDTLRTRIPWEKMTTTVTTVTFKRIKEYVLALKEMPDRRGVLVRPSELRQKLQAIDPKWQFTDAEMMTAVKHLENHGYVTILHSSSGEETILLKPDILVDLASSIVLQADKHPRELGALSETDLLQGGYPFLELTNLEQEEQQILLDAAVVRFLSHNICFRERLGAETLLIFPGLIKQKRPLLDEVETLEDISYIARGRVENVYAALVVLLSYTQMFVRVNQWQNQAQYEMGRDEICGFRLIEEREGEIELVLYYTMATPEVGRRMFQGLFEQFLYQRDVEVTPFPPVMCPSGHRQQRATVIKRLREGKRFLFCEECGERITLPEIEKPIALGTRDANLIWREQAMAHLRSMYEAHLVRIKGFRRDRTAPRCYISHLSEQGSFASQLAQDLRAAGIYVLEDKRQIKENDFLILVGTPAYKQILDHSDKSLLDEADLIRTHVQQPTTQWPTIVPLLFEGDLKSAHIRELQDRLPGDFRDETYYVVSLFDLVLTLYAIPLNYSAFKPLRMGLQKQWEETLGRVERNQSAASVEEATTPRIKSAPLKVFISYAHKDEEFKDELITMLASLQRLGIIDVWQDRRIQEGDEWYQSIQDAMNSCDLVLLIVSKYFLASRFIMDEELPRLLERRKAQGLCIVPIIARPCVWQTEIILKDLQALPKDGRPLITFPQDTGERDQVWADIAKAIEARAGNFTEELK